MRFGTVGVCGVTTVLLLALPAVADNEWFQWRGPNRDGISTATGLIKQWPEGGPRALWKATELGNGYASVSIADGRIFTTGNFDDGQAVLAVDAKTGKLLWKKPITTSPPKHGHQGSRCTPTVDGDLLYVTRSDGGLVCMKGSDGSVVWQKDYKKDFGGKMMSGWGFSESPLVDGDRVICTPGGQSSMLVALKKDTGTLVWKTIMPEDLGPDRSRSQGKRKSLKNGAGYASIVIGEPGGVKQYIQFVGRGVIGVRASDGKFLWRYSEPANGTANCSNAVVSGDLVFGASAYGTGGGLARISGSGDAFKAAPVYFEPAMQNHHGGMVKVGDHLYGFGSGGLICMDFKTGKVAWKDRSVGKGSLIYADGMLYCLGERHQFALVEATPEAYREHGRFEIEKFGKHPTWAHPAISDGILYLRNQHELTAYEIKAR